jgi:hypothetical protein
MRTLLLTLLAASSMLTLAAELVVYPFESQDPVVGAAVADRIAAALEGAVIGPAAAPVLVVPLVAPDGFINPSVFLGAGGPFGRNGAWLLRGAVGADAAVTGTVRFEGESAILDLVVDLAGTERRASLSGPLNEPGVLADRAARLLAAWTGLGSRPLPPLDLRGPDAAHARAIALVGAGLPREALQALDDAPTDRSGGARAATLARTLRGVIEEGRITAEAEADVEWLAVAAVAALSAGDLDLAAAAFGRLADAGVPVGHLWRGALAHNAGDAAGAATSFDRGATPAYAFGRAARAAYRFAVGDARGGEADLAALAAASAGATPEAGAAPGSAAAPDAAGILAAAIAASLAQRTDIERELLIALGRRAPYLAYSFERRSFIAFDADDGQAAAEALAVAVDLEPESDLYWTNYGWALYLVGLLTASEDASQRALAIDPSQYIARYNLALVQIVTDRLDASLASYREARRFDPGVDPESVADLVQAETRFPEALGVAFALGTMLEAAGDRAAAADAFERYAASAEASPTANAASPARAREARERALALRAPLPPIGVTGDVRLRLGRRGPTIDAPRPGDPLVVSFEVTTTGDALPRRLDVAAVLEDAMGRTVASEARSIDVPLGAIGYVVEVVRLALPTDLGAGRYTLRVSADGEGLVAEALRSLEVAGDADVVRGLIGRDVAMLSLETGQALYQARDVDRGTAVLEALVRELRSTADAADAVLPVPASGRFAERSGGDIFRSSTTDDVRDFIAYVLAEGAEDTSFTFVDGYADWAVAGAP